MNVDGRAGYKLDPNSAIQNWSKSTPAQQALHIAILLVVIFATESGVAVTMIGCTFFRNFASYAMAAFQVFDLWPHVVVVESTDLIHNDALVVQDEIFRWTAIVRAYEISLQTAVSSI